MNLLNNMMGVGADIVGARVLHRCVPAAGHWYRRLCLHLHPRLAGADRGSAGHVQGKKKSPAGRGAEEFICCRGDKAARETKTTLSASARRLPTITCSTPRDRSPPSDAELGGQQPLDLRGEHMFFVIRRTGIVAGLAVVAGFALGFVSPVELVDGLR